MYQNILVGFDDSPSSRAALTEAGHWVKKHGGAITLVHAAFFEAEEFSIAPEQLERRLQAGERCCGLAKEKIQAEHGVTVRTLLREGDPPAAILETAREMGSDLIVLGTYGRRGLNRMLMGSVTAQVISRSPVDVLVVKRPCSECKGEYPSILVPFDGSDFSKRALVQASRLAKVDNAKVTVLYSIPRYEEMIGFLKTESIRQSLAQEAGKILVEASQLASIHGVTVQTEIAEGPAAARIVEKAAKAEIDLIAMGSHGYQGVNRALLGSTAERVITHAACPVLVVRGTS